MNSPFFNTCTKKILYILFCVFFSVAVLSTVLAVVLKVPLEWGQPLWLTGIFGFFSSTVIAAIFCAWKKSSQTSVAQWVDYLLLPRNVLLAIVVVSVLMIALTLLLPEELVPTGDAGSFTSGTIGVAASIIGTVISVYIAGLAYKMAYNVQQYAYLERYQDQRNEAIEVVSALQNYQRNMSLHFKELIKNCKHLQKKLQPQLDVAHIQFRLAESSVLQHFYNYYPRDSIEHLPNSIRERLEQLNERDLKNRQDIFSGYMTDADADQLSKTNRGFYDEQLQWLNRDEKSKHEKWLELLQPVTKELRAMAELQAELHANNRLFPVLSAHADALYASEDYLMGLQLDDDGIKASSSDGLAASAFLAHAYTQHLLPERLQDFYDGPVDRDVSGLLFASLLFQVLAKPQHDFISTLESKVVHAQLVDHLLSLLYWLPQSSEELDRIYCAELVHPETLQPERFYAAYALRRQLVQQQHQLQLLVERLQPERDAEIQRRKQDDPAQEFESFAENRLQVLRQTATNQVVQSFLDTAQKI